MARSCKKFLSVSISDFFQYILELEDATRNEFIVARNKTINNLNCRAIYTLHQGKVKHRLPFNEYYIGYKAGEISKTRKPFFFRSKRKKRSAT